MVARDRVPVYVLAGGKSSRLGEDKALVDVRGEPLIARVVRSLQPVAERITLVADEPERLRRLGLRIVTDIEPGLGPMAGLQAALRDLGSTGWLLAASCDLVGLRSGWLRRLLQARHDDADAVAFRGETWQPLPALFSAAIAAEVDQAIEARQLALWRILARARTVEVPMPSDWDEAVDVDDPAALERARLERPDR